ncbi:FAD:protein FMN transferase [Actinospica durhamensis]|uniref:FAD:protein FMN transferase n=1 Tax=Actinospica durhamensis TaxID=1508375 RepID=A0A941IUQ2_9ACTN|nr:FAD:protein FMN transferase [Actinospica durhamensis]MBR7837853.1 FAD:protein FMN transferase [Actinospica durhamensis]
MNAAPAAPARAGFPLWGGVAVVLSTDPDSVSAARDLVWAETCAMDVACSRFRDDSELARVNAAAGTAVTVGPLFAEVVSAALRAAAATDGDVDPTCGAGLEAAGYDRDIEVLRHEGVRFTVRERVPAPGWQSVSWNPATMTLRTEPGCRLDFGAVAKALAADRAAHAAARELGCGVLVGLGGDIATAGPAPVGGWQIKIADDHRAEDTVPGPVVSVLSGALATSSTTTRRWDTTAGPAHHILDPRTGAPADAPWRTVSVTAATCVDANTASTAALVRGEAAPAWLEHQRLPARLVRDDGRVLTLGGWPSEPDADGPECPSPR